MTRAFWVFLHRWAGLAMAGFLIVAGLTGSLLAFLPELNHWLSPQLFPAPRAGAVLDVAALARRAEALVPQGRANIVYLVNPGAAIVYMDQRPGSAEPLGFNRLFLDPVTGDELGRRQNDALPTGLDEIMPFVYRLHYSLAMGPTGGWIMGIAALVWTIDCFVAFYLTLPNAARGAGKGFFSRWKPAWLVKLRGSAYRINFDLHRAGGLWLWIALFIFAWSSVYMELNGFYTRVMSFLFDYEQAGYYQQVDFKPAAGQEPLSWEEAQETAHRLMDEQARAHGFVVKRPLALALVRDKGLYRYRVHSGLDIGDKYGWTYIYFDAFSGALRKVELPTRQRSGNTITTWLTELHRADLFGLPYRIFVCALGLVITMLSVTGVYIWQKKRAARQEHMRRAAARAAPAGQFCPHAKALFIEGEEDGF